MIKTNFTHVSHGSCSYEYVRNQNAFYIKQSARIKDFSLPNFINSYIVHKSGAVAVCDVMKEVLRLRQQPF